MQEVIRRVFNRCEIECDFANNFNLATFHTLRHTYGSRYCDVSTNYRALSSILGHTDVSFTLNTYVHPSINTLRTEVDKLIIR